MVKFGSFTFPRVLALDHEQPRLSVEKPLPGRSWAYRDDIAGLGARFSLAGEIYPEDEDVRDQIAALADGTARIFDPEFSTPEFLEACQLYDGAAYNDNTAEAKSAGGTPFTLLGDTNDIHYFGHREKFKKLEFDLQTLGSYGTRTWQYSKGGGSWGTLSVTDGTNGFTQDGVVSFTPPSDWKQSTVNGVTKFWVRVSVASVTTAATVNQIKTALVYLAILLNPVFRRQVENYKTVAYTCEVIQQENP